MKEDKPIGIALSHNGRLESAPNPYLDARRHWNSASDHAFSSLRVWQAVGISGLMIAVAGLSIAYIGTNTKYVPYVISVDRLGEAVSVGPAKPASHADPLVIRSLLGSFISSARLVTPDTELQRAAVFRVYGLLRKNDPATNRMNEYMNDDAETSPFKRAKNFLVSTDKFTVMPVSDSSWQVEWEETKRDRDGNVIGKVVNMRSTLQVYIDPPAAGALQGDIQKNPIGLWVRDFSWEQR